MRASFNIDISDSTSWLLAAGYSEHDINGYPSKQEGTAFPLGVVNPITALAGSPLDGSLSFAEVEFSPAAERGKFEVFQTNPDVFDKLKSHYFTSELNFKIGSVDVVLLSDYREFDYASLKDVDNVNTFLTEGSTVFDEFGEEFSHELRFSGSSNTLQWLAGAFVFRLLDPEAPEAPGANPETGTRRFRGRGRAGGHYQTPGCPGAGPRRSLERQGGAVLGVSRLIGYPKLRQQRKLL